MTEVRTLTDDDAKAIAKQVNTQMFEIFGFDISTAEGRIEAQGAFRWLMLCYRGVGIVGKTAIGGATLLVVGYVVYKLTGWSGPPSP